MRKFYVVEGDTSSRKEKIAYPKLALCDDCVSGYCVISEGERTYKPCAKCGAEN